MSIPALIPALPEIVLATLACFILVMDAFLGEKRRLVIYWATQLTLLSCAVITWQTFSLSGDSYTFFNMFVDDVLADVLKFFSYIAVSLILFYSRDYLQPRGLFSGEFFVLSLFALLGMMVMISASHFLTLYLGLELMSLCLYAMVALQRDSKVCSEAAMKYFVLGALASGMLLYGMSMIYGATGSLQIGQVSAAAINGQANATLMLFGLVFIISGIAFKLGVVPYHMWVPDVYHGSPTAVTIFIGTVPKLAAFAFVMRLLVGALPTLVVEWREMLIILSVLSMVIGNLIAIAQSNLKRMLAYSTIANMGYMLLGILAGDSEGFRAAMFYTVAYVLVSLAGFGMILLLTREGFEADQLSDLKGLNRRNPWYALLMLLVMFSLAGIPPTIGFYAKLSVIWSVVNIGLIWLAVTAVLMSLVGAFYYLRVVKLMYFDDAQDLTPIEARGDTQLLLSVNGLALLVLGIFPERLLTLCLNAIDRSLL